MLLAAFWYAMKANGIPEPLAVKILLASEQATGANLNLMGVVGFKP